MKTWKQKQKECPLCLGTGLRHSEQRHPDGHTPHAWTALCSCQPRTIRELEEAVKEEESETLTLLEAL